MNDDPRFWLLDFDEQDHRADFNATTPVCIVDEEAGGIIAYAVSEDAAQLLLDALSSIRPQ